MSLNPDDVLRESATVSKALTKLDEDTLHRILGNWKLTPATFAQKLSRGLWIPSPHLQYIALRLALAIAKGNARIILSMPPRHGKSELVSIYTPAWLLEYVGNLNIILASYGADLAEGFARRVRGIIRDPSNEHLLRVRIGDLSRAEEFNTSLGGYMYAVGLGGAITGRGADVLLIDDYIKEIKEALSPAYRDYIWNWYVTTALTRLEPNGSVIIIATRWHSDDLIGRLRQHEPDRWEYIELPALALENDIVGRQVGQPLFPERYTYDDLMALKGSLGTIFFEALFQQRPVDETMRVTDTSWLQMWPRSKPLPPRLKMCRTWDLAATEGGGDYLTGTLCGYDAQKDDFFILDIFRDQLPPGKIENAVYQVAEADGFNVDIGIEREPGSAGKILVQHFKDNVLSDFRVEAIDTGGKAKVIRAQPFLAAAEDGHVYYLQDTEDRRWNKVFVDEFEVFPASSHTNHDDTVDTSAEGYTFLTGKKALPATWGRSGKADKQAPSTNRRSGTRNSFKIRQEQERIKMAPGSPKLKGATWGSRTVSTRRRNYGDF
jgi:predicted phage terminase large subunit-like protein